MSEVASIREESTDARADAIFQETLTAMRSRVDRLFAALMVVQWVGGVALAVFASPRSWSGSEISVHIHVWAALCLGGLLSSLPIYLAWSGPGDATTRHVIAVAQMLWSSLLIHLTGGRIETHFHIFGSLAFLAFYRDWRILATASAVVADDHFLRGYFWPQSIFGVQTVSIFRPLEHVAWVVFEDVFLLLWIRQGLSEMHLVARKQAELETARNDQERLVIERTKELAQATKEAQAANRAKSEFLANMSHEIRTPMAAILGYAEVVRDPETGVNERKNAISIIERNGNYLLELINDILDLSRIEAGRFETQRVNVSPAATINEVVRLMQVRAGQKQLSLNANFGANVPETFVTDPTRLRQILINLVGNAIKFTDQGEVRIDAEADNERLRFIVQDTGAGISLGDQKRLFQPFSQVDTSTTRKFGGAGLGLAISRRFAEILGGAIDVYSRPGKGARFTVTLPIVSEPVGDSVSPRNEPASHDAAVNTDNLAGMRILLAEDGPDNQRLFGFWLRKAGADVDLAVNGKQALEKALATGREESPYDIVLMDMQMPVLDGYDATRQLRKANFKRPIIALTAHAMVGDREKCLDAGCSDYATKPISRDALLGLIGKHAGSERESA